MSGIRNGNGTDPWRQRVDSGDWRAIAAELDSYGGALLPQLLAPGEAKQLRGLYDDPGRFRSTVNMCRHRFGEGEYRYFAAPCPEPVGHGVSVIRSGERHTLGLVFHDAP